MKTRRTMFCCLSVLAAGLLAAVTSHAAEPTATVVEFYNTTLKHYFVTADAVEAAGLQGGYRADHDITIRAPRRC